MSRKKNRILLKISGGNLKDNSNSFIFDSNKLNELSDQINQLRNNYEISIVLGGGNIWRGKTNNLNELSNSNSDYVGMLATLVNGIVLRDFLKNKNINVRLFSEIECPKVSELVNLEKVESSLNNGEVVIFAGGTGQPFVTTDTAATIQAIKTGSKFILMGKDGVSGVYDKDPKIHNDALFFEKLSYDEVVNMGLQVMDMTSLTLAKENNIKFLIFDQSKKDCFLNAINRKIQLTEIS